MVSVRAGGAESRDTTVLLAHRGPQEVRFCFEPTGARLELRYADGRTRGFHERYMKGERVRAGWVNGSDFEKDVADDVD